MTTYPDILTAGRYGYGRRRVHRDDFARVVCALLPPPGATRIRPQVVVDSDTMVRAGKHCRRLAERHSGEPIARLAAQVADRLLHPGTNGGPGELVLYAAALLCREEQARATGAAAVDLGEKLEAAFADRIATVLETAVTAPVRFTIETSFDSDLVRGSRQTGIAAPAAPGSPSRPGPRPPRRTRP
ncbi:hypothetical protein [Catenulispora rubra]|uniref:hypothetical protein n=1 Tax=Catenulispora rubra TaxID=280293 RepID=UPI0018921718|nr:hypothetical protein [Catenulispora rubra]